MFQKYNAVYIKLNGILLTGDGQLRKQSSKSDIEIRGILYLFDLLIAEGKLSYEAAIHKLKELAELNSRLPENEGRLRLEEWDKKVAIKSKSEGYICINQMLFLNYERGERFEWFRSEKTLQKIMKEQLLGIVRVKAYENRLVHCEYIEILSQNGLTKQEGDEISFFPVNYKTLFEKKLLSKICKDAKIKIWIQGNSVEIMEFL
jgi:hypothetical protein